MSRNARLVLKMLRDEALDLLPGQQRLEAAIPGLALTRFDGPTKPEQCLHHPLLALVIQGRKQAFYGEREVAYGAGQYVVLCNDMPGVFQISQATPAAPFLSVSLRLDYKLLASLNLEYGLDQKGGRAASIGMAQAPEELILAFYRLLRLLRGGTLDQAFSRAIIRELHYYILRGELGGKLRFPATPGDNESRIAQALAWLRAHFRDDFPMPDLAAVAGMSASTFNRRFRQATSLSPLQFQKALRLYEAQRLMVVESYDARSAAAAVGYESGAQFSREYKRLFGAPPARDAISLRK